MLGIDEGAGAADLLHFRDDLQRQRGFAGGLRPVDFDDPTAGQATDAQSDVQTQ